MPMLHLLPFCHQVVLGSDARFTLDDRFAEDDDGNAGAEVAPRTDECDLQKEKAKQLDILGSILGEPLAKKDSEKSDARSTK